MPFVPNTDEQRRSMLDELGLSAEDLFADIPPELRAKALDVGPGMSEQAVVESVGGLAATDRPAAISFVGGGFYDHFVPATVDAVLRRGEFYTAYTPYQPEISQGTLQAIYEYQSAVCRLTGMEVANASLYDGGTAVYEAVMTAARVTGRAKVIVDGGLNPIYRRMLATHAANRGLEIFEVACGDGRPDRARIAEEMDDTTAALLVAYPSFFGVVDDFSDLALAAHDAGALLIASCYPVALGLLKTPGAMGADVVVAEGQSLGLPLSFGGPYLGILAARMEYARKLPGRIAGRTVDAQAREGFVLTLQAREQHIRRAKASSNICTNEALCALGALVFLSTVGKDGLAELAQLCADLCALARSRLANIPGVALRFPGAVTFNEFVLELPVPAEPVVRALMERGIAPGIPLGAWYTGMDRCLLVCLTEKRTPADVEALARELEAAL